MDADMALAAAYASGEQPPAVAFAPQPARSLAHGRKPPRGHAIDQGDDGAMEELPNIDDLEVAAAAAGVAPVPPVLAELGYFELGPPAAAAPEPMERSVAGSEEDSSSEESDEEEEELCEAAVRLHLEVMEGDPPLVRAQLVPKLGLGSAEVDSGAEVEPDSSFASSDASSSDSESSGGAESDDEQLDVVENYEQLKQMISDMDAKPAALDDDDDDDGGGDGGGGAHRAEQELLGAAPLPSLAGLEVSGDEPVTLAGEVQTMLEGMVVIKAQGGSRALNEGSVLVLEDRTPIGCIEEIFGPVVSPLYALRYAGAGPAPEALQPGVPVFSLDRLADFVLPEELRVRGFDAGAEEEEGPLEAQFSDDEEEARHRRAMEAKGRPQGEPARGRGPKQPGRGRGGRAGGRGSRHPPAGAPQQQQPVASYHPHQQHAPPPGRVFSGRLQRRPPPPGFQAQAAAAQLTGMSIQQQQQQQWQGGMPMQAAPPGGFVPYNNGGFYAAPPPPMQQPMMGAVLRPQYAVAPPPRGPGRGAVMQPQYVGRPPMFAQQPAPVGFTPQFIPPQQQPPQQ